MPLHHKRNGYNFLADAKTLSIKPGPAPITLSPEELGLLGLAFRDDYRIPLGTENKESSVLDSILASLHKASDSCGTPEDSWIALNLRRAMVLNGGLDEEMAQKI